MLPSSFFDLLWGFEMYVEFWTLRRTNQVGMHPSNIWLFLKSLCRLEDGFG